jgi:hypothetical protein
MSVKSFTEAAVEAVASRSRDKIVDFVLSQKPDEFWIMLWKKHGTLIDWPTTILNAILQDVKSIPDPVRDFIMNTSEDLIDAISKKAKSYDDGSSPSPSTPHALPTQPSHTLRDGMMKIVDSAKLSDFMDGLQRTGRRNELLQVSGTENYIGLLVESIIDNKDDDAELKKIAESALGKKTAEKLTTEVELNAATRVKVSQVLGRLGNKKAGYFFYFVGLMHKNIDGYLDALEARTEAEIEAEIEKIYSHSVSAHLAVAADYAKKVKPKVVSAGKKFWGWVEPRMFFLAVSVVIAIGTIGTGIVFSIPVLIGGGILLGMMIAACAWLFSGVLPLFSLVLKKQLYPDSIKKLGFWIACVGSLSMMIRGIIHGPEALIALVIILVATALVMQITKFKSEKAYWVILGIMIALFSLTYVMPKDYSAICRSLSKGNKLWIADRNARATKTDIKATIREAYTKKFINSVYDSSLKIVKEVHLPKGFGVRYFDFNDEVKISKNGIPFAQIAIPDSNNEYHEEGPFYFVEANLIEVNQGSDILSFLPIGKKDLGLETSPDGSYSVKTWKEGFKQTKRIVFNTDSIFVEDLPVGKKWIMSGAAYGDVTYNNPKTGEPTSYMFNFSYADSPASLTMKAKKGTVIFITFS